MGHLDDLLPIRRILVDGVPQPFVRDLDLASDAFTVSTDPDSGVASLGIAIAAEDFTTVLTVDRNTYQLAEANTLGEVSIALASSGHVAGATKAIVIAAGTVASADNFSYPSDLDPSGNWDALDPASDYVAVISCVDGTGSGKFVASGKDLGLRTTSAPTLVSAEIAGGLDKLVIVFSAPMLLPDLTGISLTGTSSVPSSLYAVSADKTTWTIDLDANIGSASSVSLVIASTRTWRSLNGTLIAAGTHAVTTEFDFSTLDGIRLYFDPATHCNVTTDGGAVTAINTTLGSSADFTGTCTYRATGIGGRPAVEANGSSDVMDSASVLSDVISATEFWIAQVVKVDAISSDNATPYINVATFNDGNGGGVGVGLYLKSTGPTLVAYVFSGGLVSVTKTFTLAQAALLTMRLKSGQLYVGVDGVEAAGVACGSATLTATLRMFRGSGGGVYYDGMGARLVVCNVDPSQRAAATAALKSYYGIA